MKFLQFTLLLTLVTTLPSSDAFAGKRPEMCITFRDHDGLRLDALGSDGQGAYCGGGIVDNYVYFNSGRDFRGRELRTDFSWYEDLSPFAANELPFADEISLIEFYSKGIGLMQPGDPPQPVRLKIYFDVGEREFDLIVYSDQANPIMVEATADGSLRITGSPDTVGLIHEYRGKGRKTTIREVGTTFVSFEVIADRR